MSPNCHPKPHENRPIVCCQYIPQARAGSSPLQHIVIARQVRAAAVVATGIVPLQRYSAVAFAGGGTRLLTVLYIIEHFAWDHWHEHHDTSRSPTA